MSRLKSKLSIRALALVITFQMIFSFGLGVNNIQLSAENSNTDIKKNNVLPEADTDPNPTPGTVYYWGDWTKNTFEKQGQQGFYAMFSTEVN
ncbi:MAG: hypothetical protein GX957_15890, partial [Clostridiaceae bacterium]|nr:hypothetical protein [Clostridiaceae bacterium]